MNNHFRCVLIDPELGTMREGDDYPWQWETETRKNMVIAYENDLTKKGCKICGFVYHGMVAISPAQSDLVTNQQFFRFLTFVDNHLSFVPAKQ